MPDLFRSEGQRNEVCLTLCLWTGQPALWSRWPARGPSERCGQVAAGALASAAETAIARIAWALWTGRGELRFGDLLADCEPDARKAIDSLLEALLDGTGPVDAWIEEHGLEGEDAETVEAGRAQRLRLTGTL